MGPVDHESNPLKPVAIPLGIRALFATLLALSLLLEFAREMMSGFGGSSAVALLTALLLVGFALRDGVAAFKAWLRLPEHALEVRGIDGTYAAHEIKALMMSGVSPNDKYLSWVGRWAARASNRFFTLPPVYQRLVEVALVGLAYGAIAVLLIVLLRVFGMAGGNVAASDAVISWLMLGIVLLAFAYWFAMLWNIYSAADWGRKFAPGRIVNMMGTLLLLVVGAAFLAQFMGFRLSRAPTMQPWGTIVVAGSIVVIAGILVLARLRSGEVAGKAICSRINLNDSAATHPQNIVDAFRSVLTQPKGGSYVPLGEWKAVLDEQLSTGGGVFTGSAVGEYAIKAQDVVLSGAIRRFAILLGILGVLAGAVGYGLIWIAARGALHHHWLTAACLLLFAGLTLRIAIFPLSERTWSSYLIGIQINGNYHRRGGERGAELITAFQLDGGVAVAQSVSHLPSFLVKADATRVLTRTVRDDAEREAILGVMRSHLVGVSRSS